MSRQILSESFHRGFESMKHQRYHQTFTCLGLYIAKTTWNLFVLQCLYKIPAQDNILCGDIFIQLDFWYPFGDIAGNQRRPWLSCDLQKPNYWASSVKDRKETSFWHKSGFQDSWCWKLYAKFSYWRPFPFIFCRNLLLRSKITTSCLCTGDFSVKMGIGEYTLRAGAGGLNGPLKASWRDLL